MKSKVITWTIIVVVLLGLIIWKLVDNKKTLDNNAELSLVTNTVIPVIVEKPQLTHINRTFNINGRIEAGNEVMILSKAQGIVIQKYKRAGDFVNKGNVIAQLENSVIRESLRIAEADLLKVQKDVDRFQRLAASGAVAIRELEDCQLTLRNSENRIVELKDQLANTTIVAPVSGVLSEDYVEEGSLATIGGMIANIVSDNSLKMKISVTEKEVLQLKKGDTAIITTDVFPGESFSGTVDMISPQGNQQHSYLVEIVLRGDSKKLKPGMYATAQFNPADGEADKIIVSRKAIVGGMKNPHVWIVKNGEAYKVSVETGLYNSEYIEITKGLTLNDIVINSGQVNLSDGFEISILNK